MTRNATLSRRTGQTVRVAALASMTLLAFLGLEPTSAHASDLVVRYDQSQLLRLPRPAVEIIVGNPSIADVSVQGGDLMVITGKSFGVTNVIALDSERNVIQDQRVLVQRDDQRTVNLHRGAVRNSYTCTPNCTPTLTVGDDPGYFESVLKTAQNKAKFSEASADAGTGGGQ